MNASLESNSHISNINKPKFNTAQHQFTTHYDAVEFCYNEITQAFAELGAIVPSISDLASGRSGFINARVEDKRLKGKVGYVINLGWHGGLPTFSLTVNSFKGGQDSRSVNSGSIIAPYLAELSNKPELAAELKATAEKIRQNNLVQQAKGEKEAKEKATKEAKERRARFDAVDAQYQNGVLDGLQSHPYNLEKCITVFGDMRIIENNCTCNPIRKIASSEVLGYQIVYPNGFKKVISKFAGSTKGGYIYVSGNIDSHHIFIGEGFASAEKISKLKSPLQKHSGTICAISANNLPKLVKAIKLDRERNHKKYMINLAPDNDHIKGAQGNGNTGIKFGMEAAMIAGKNCKLYIPEFEADDEGTDWDDKWRDDKAKAKSEFKATTYTQFEAIIAVLESLPVRTSRAQTLKVVQKACLLALPLFPLQMTEDALIDAIFNALKYAKASKKVIRSTFNRFCSIHSKKALAITSIEQDVDGVEYIEAKNIEEANQIIKDMNEATKDNGLVVMLKSPMGSGKTQVVIKGIMEEAQENGKFPIAVAPVCSLIIISKNVGAPIVWVNFAICSYVFRAQITLRIMFGAGRSMRLFFLSLPRSLSSMGRNQDPFVC